MSPWPVFHPLTEGLYLVLDLSQGSRSRNWATPSSSRSLAAFSRDSWEPMASCMVLYQLSNEKSIGTKGILKIMFFTKWQFLLLCHQQTYILHQHFEQLLIGPTFYIEIVIMATLHLSTGNWWIRRYYENCYFHVFVWGLGQYSLLTWVEVR